MKNKKIIGFISIFLLVATVVYGAWPSLTSRTKNWSSSEILTETDLESSFDELHTYINAMMNSSTGHKHDATTSEGPKIATLDSTVTGDITFSGEVDFTDTGASHEFAQTVNVTGDVTASDDLSAADDVVVGDAISVGGNADITGDTSISGALTANGNVYVTNKTILKYGSSATTGSAVTFSDLHIAYGTFDVAPEGGSQAITGLPFTTSTSYAVTVTYESTAITTSEGGAISVVKDSGSQFTIYNGGNQNKDINWIAIGK